MKLAARTLAARRVLGAWRVSPQLPEIQRYLKIRSM